MQQYSKELESFLDFLRQCRTDLDEAKYQEELMDKQTQDILHHMELEENSQFDYICEGISLKDIRRKRREAKNKIKVLTPMVEWISTNQKTIDVLTQVLGKIRKEERSAERRLYSSRTCVLKNILEDNDE